MNESNVEVSNKPIYPFMKKSNSSKGSKVSTKAKSRGKEIRVDTHYKEKVERERKLKRLQEARKKREQQKLLEHEESLKTFKKKAVKTALKNEELAQSLKNKEVKVKSNGQKESQERLKRATKTPFSYYYNVSKYVSNNIGYCNIYQCMNDKFAGRLFQPQYFAIAEQSERIFEINKLLIIHSIGIALLHEETSFLVQVSPKYLESDERYKELESLLENAPTNLILCMDARPLILIGDEGRKRLLELIEKYKLSLMLDNPETERLSVLFDYPIKYIRLDGRYYVDRSENKKQFIKIINDYCKGLKIDLVAKYIDTKEDKSWMLANGVRYIEGANVQTNKSNVNAALK